MKHSTKMKIYLSYIIVVLVLFCIEVPYIFASFEKLNEIENRKTRKYSNTFYHGASTGNDFVRQSQMLIYNDIQTGHEVCVLTNNNNQFSQYHGEISPANPWSADGKRLGFFSSMAPEGFSSTLDGFGGGTVGYVIRSDGSYLRETIDASYRSHHNSSWRFFVWNPAIPDVYYAFGESGSGRGLNTEDFYKNTVSDNEIAYNKLFSFPSGNRYQIYKVINPSGTHTVAMSWDGQYYYPIQLKGTPKLLDEDGWSFDRSQGTNYGGGIKAKHELYFPDPTGKWFIHMNSVLNTNGFWKYNLTGNHIDGGPKFIDLFTAFDSQEVEPMWMGFTTFPSFQIQKNLGHWWGHPGFDRWGRLVAHGAGAAVGGHLGGSDVVFDYVNRQYDYSKNTIAYATHDLPRSYTDWSAWSDFVSCSNRDNDDSVPNGNYVFVYKYDKIAADNEYYLVAKHHGRQNNPTSYCTQSFARQTQSPDGTKIAYEVEFMTSAQDKSDIAYAVAYYPYPPEIVNTISVSGTVTVRFDWQNEIGDPYPRTYTKRGWPNESTNDRPIPRETSKYRLWRSVDNINWEPIKTIDAEHFSKFDFQNGDFKEGHDRFWEITDTPGTGSWFYAITSVEHSGLESRSLSNIFKIIISEGGGSGNEVVKYPVKPGEKTNFITRKPSPPLNIQVIKKSTAGHHLLSWAKPLANHQLIRYYNIYYSTTQTPLPIPENRIASVPANATNYTDWLAESSSDAFYIVTSVDTQGNESSDLLTSLKVWKE